MMEDVEAFFCASSELVVHFIKNNGAAVPAQRLAIPSFSMMLRLMIPDPRRQVAFLERISASFFEEMNGDKALKIELDKLYRSCKQEVWALADDLDIYRRLRIKKQAKRFLQCIGTLVSKTRNFEQQRQSALYADLIHMHLNRVYPEKQRQQEMLAYHCLLKYKQSCLHLSGRAPLSSLS